MLLVVKAGREPEVERIFEKWDLHAVNIGQVTGDGMLRIRERGVVVADIPNHALTDAAPVYNRPTAVPAYLAEVTTLDLDALGDGPADAGSMSDRLLSLLEAPTVTSKEWVYRQYDHMVQTNTVVVPGMGAGVMRIKGTSRALAMSVDGNGRYGYLDPRRGAMLAVAEAARNVACAGARPLAATNCLNFGNPERPEIMWQFVESVAGIGDACRALGVPITGGNVSLYNETDRRAIYPTPVIGVVGVAEHADRALGRRFQAAGDSILLLGDSFGELGGSEYLKSIHGLVRGVPPRLDLETERRLQQLVVALAGDALIRSAHDCSDGGVAVTLAECCFGSGFGAEVALPAVSVSSSRTVNDAAALFGESASRVVVSAAPERVAEITARAVEGGVPVRVLGNSGGPQLRISIDSRIAVDVEIAHAEEAWSSTISRYFVRRVA